MLCVCFGDLCGWGFLMFEDLFDFISLIINDMLGFVVFFLEGYVWSWLEQVLLFVVLLLGMGFFVIICLGLIQLCGFKYVVDIVCGKYDDLDDDGDLVYYQVLMMVFFVMVGIGNIVGVVIVICLGGLGVFFWMWVMVFFGMVFKFVECIFVVVYCMVYEDGLVFGGLMYYIECGFGLSWKWMVVLFVVLVVICLFGIGNMNQVNMMVDQFESQFGVDLIWSVLVFVVFIVVVIVGGIWCIGCVILILVLLMVVVYVGGVLIIFLLNILVVLSGFVLIV